MDSTHAFLGEIRMFPVGLQSKQWLPCDGRLLDIRGNDIFFSYLRYTFGGEGSQFAIPDLRGRAAMNAGQGKNLSAYKLGQKSGTSTVGLSTEHLPQHGHTVNCSEKLADSSLSQGNNITRSSRGKAYIANGGPVPMNKDAMALSGGANMPHDNMMPYLVMDFYICIDGALPK